MTDEERLDLGKKILAAKKTKFTPEQDDYIKTHTVAECLAKFWLSTKPILKRRKELGISIYRKFRN